RVFNLTKYPRVRHRAATDENAVTISLAPTLERVLDRHDIAAPGHGHTHGLFHLPHKVPVGETLVSLLLRSTMQRDVLDSASLGESRDLDRIPVAVVIARANFYGDRKSTRLNSSHSQISYAVFCLK